MARYDYSATMSEHGKFVLELEAELEVQVTLGPDFDMTVTAVLVEGIDLLKSSNSAFVGLGIDIAGMAEADDQFIAKVMAREGVTFRGLGANDPSGHFVREVA